MPGALNLSIEVAVRRLVMVTLAKTEVQRSEYYLKHQVIMIWIDI